MNKCVIIAPLYTGEEKAWLEPCKGDLLLCADGGYDAARRHGFTPDLVIGDFDSKGAGDVTGCEVIRLPVHKDDTDMVACLREARGRGYTRFRIAGCLGGRLDHTFANLQCLYDCALRGEDAWMCDACNRVTVLLPGEHIIPAAPGRRLSLLAFTPEVTGVRLEGTLWPLEGATLTQRFPLGVSNEFTAPAARLSFASGALLLVLSADAEICGVSPADT